MPESIHSLIQQKFTEYEVLIQELKMATLEQNKHGLYLPTLHCPTRV